MREFVEELYGVEELETGDGRVDPQAIYRRREAACSTTCAGLAMPPCSTPVWQ
jgi:hypothetical protein